MTNPFVHVELTTDDLDKAKSFYRSLFDWKLNDMDMGGGMTYTMIDVGEGTGGGMLKHPIEECSICLASLRQCRKHRRSYGRGKIARRKGLPRSDGGAECVLVLDHRRSNRRDAGPLATAEEVASDERPFTEGRDLLLFRAMPRRAEE